MNYLEELEELERRKANTTTTEVEESDPSEDTTNVGTQYTDEELSKLSAPRYTKGDYIASGLVPAIIGILGGAPDIGYSVAAETLSGMKNEENSDLEAMRKLVAARRKGKGKDSAGKPKLTKGVSVMYKGKPTIMDVREEGGKAYHPNTGEELQVAPYGDYKAFTGDEGEKRLLSSKYGLQGRVGTGTTPKQEVRNIKFTDTLTKSKEYTTPRASIDASDSIQALLESGNPISEAAVGQIMPRLMGEVGAMTEGDKAPYRGDQSIRSSVARIMAKWKTGRITEKDKKYLYDLTNTMKTSAGRRMNAYLDRARTSGAKGYGVSEDYVTSVVSPLYYTHKPTNLKFNASKDSSEQTGAQKVIDTVKEYAAPTTESWRKDPKHVQAYNWATKILRDSKDAITIEKAKKILNKLGVTSP